MASELCLTWNDHHKSLVGVFERLLDKSTLVDCTIAAEGQYLKAHKIILSACSPYFELLFSQESEKNPIVVLKDIKFQELKALIDFIYKGEVKVPKECLGDFVDAAESLQIKGLGSGKHQEMSPQNTGNDVVRTRGRVWTSPLPCKRMRPTDFGVSFERSDSPQVNEMNFESEEFQGPSHEFRVEAPCTFQDETRLSFSSVPNSLTIFPSSVSSAVKNFDTTESVLFLKSPLTQSEGIHPHPDSLVVKSEPEEIYISDSECYIEPKDKGAADDVELVGGGEEPDSELVTNEFPDISTMAQSSATMPETVFVPQLMEATSSLGAAPASAGGVLGLGVAAATTVEARTVVQDPRAPAAPRSDGGAPSSRAKESPAARGPTTCEVCSRVCRSASELTLHLRVHTGERPYRCDECGKSFSQRGILQLHSRTHRGERPFRCGDCGKCFTQKCILEVHTRVHTGERPFRCAQCGKRFRQSCSLKVHTLTHTGERPIRCDQCGKAFTRVSVLNAHKLIHTGEKPFRCDHCGKEFTRRAALDVHVRIHTGEQPHRCDDCGKAFTRRYGLKQHMLLMHRSERSY